MPLPQPVAHKKLSVCCDCGLFGCKNMTLAIIIINVDKERVIKMCRDVFHCGCDDVHTLHDMELSTCMQAHSILSTFDSKNFFVKEKKIHHIFSRLRFLVWFLFMCTTLCRVLCKRTIFRNNIATHLCSRCGIMDNT